MESAITALTTHKIALAIAVIISILIVLSVLKKLLKVAAVLLALIVLYIAYLAYTGQQVPKTQKEAIKHVIIKIDQLKKESKKSFKGGL
jgi:xanthine/uracil permease